VSGALDLWTSLSVVEWRSRLLARAPSLDKASRVLARRTEVIWAEERVVDRYDSPVLQMASVHAMMRGLGRVLQSLGVVLPPAPAPSAAAPVPASRPAGAPPPAARPAAAPPRAAPRATPPVVATASPVLSPAQIAAYGRALEQEAYRILSPEMGGRSLESVVARRGEMRVATSVAQWKRALATANPELGKAAAVLERRAEVLRAQHGVLDAYESAAVQREAAKALQAGLERILRLFGK
jgi:hypothetical protein